MENQDEGITEFIHERTGLPPDLISRVVEIGEPWPFVAGFGRLLKTSYEDAKSLAVPFETALDANTALSQDRGVDGLDLDSLDRHRQQVASLSGVDEETVGKISDALHEFFQSRFDRVQRVIDQRSTS